MKLKKEKGSKMQFLLMQVGVNGCGSWAEIVDLTQLPYEKCALLSDDGGPSAGVVLLSCHDTRDGAVFAACQRNLEVK